MSLQFKKRLCHRVLACISAAGLQYAYAENLTSFESALAKVQQYQVQADLNQQWNQIAELNVQQSRLWENPSLSVEQTGFGSDQELNIGIRQPLDLFGQRRLNQEIASTANQQLQLQQQLWDAQSQLIVKYAWSQLVIAEVERSIVASQLNISKQNLDSAHKRYQAGSIARVDYERAQIEALGSERLYQQAVLQQQSAQRQITNLWGETNSHIQANLASMPWPDQSEQLVQRYIAQGWLEKLYALNIQQVHHQIENIKVQARPHPSLNVGIQRTQAPDKNHETALAVGVEVPLNIFNRQQYAIPMAQKQQILLNQQQQRELKQQILDIASSMHQLQGLRRQFETITAQISLAEKVQSRTLLGFKAGKFSMTDLQHATSQLHNLRLELLQTLDQAWQRALSAEALSLGTSYENISRSDAYTQLNKAITEQSQNLIHGGAR